MPMSSKGELDWLLPQSTGGRGPVSGAVVARLYSTKEMMGENSRKVFILLL